MSASPRVLRALQRGGFAARSGAGAWTVWRGRDRRFRPVGELAANEADRLLVAGSLAPSPDPDGAGERRVWVGKVADSATPSAEAVKDAASRHAPRTMLERIILAEKSDERRERLVRSARQFIEDMNLAHRSGLATLNWHAVMAGTRIDGGKPRDWQGDRLARSAKSRLAIIETEMGARGSRLLLGLLIRDMHRAGMAREMGLGLREIDTEARKALVRLSLIYAGKVSVA